MFTDVKEVDSMGRIFLPHNWIKGVKRVKIVEINDKLTLIPEREIDLIKFFDSLDIEDFDEIEDLKQKALEGMLEEENSL
jgi:hypothetical protein